MRKLAIFAVLMILGHGVALAQPEPPIADVPNPSGKANEVLAFWTQIVPGSTDARKPLVEARFVLMANGDVDPNSADDPMTAARQSCGAVAVSGAKAAVETRGTLVGRYRDGASGAYTRGKHYLVAICAAALDPAADSVSLALVADPGTVLPVYPDDASAQMPGPGRLGRRNGAGLEAIFTADSGCRGQDGAKGSRGWQDCADDGVAQDGSRADGRGVWPLRPMSQNAAAMTPDFVMHGGDHHYFFEGDPFWTQPADTSDRFEYWLQEFLIPSQPLLLTSPFVFVRGNHESCETTTQFVDGKRVTTRQWFGDGWFRMFAPPGVAGCLNHFDTWSFDIAPADDTSVPPFRFYVVDTSQPGQAFGAFDAAAEDGVADKAWLAHYPAVKLVYYDPATGRANRPHVGDGAIIASLNASVTACEGKSTACLPRFMLAGHQHLYQQVDLFGADDAFLTRMVVAGNGGTALDYSNLPQIAMATLPEVMVECSYGYPHDRPFGQDVARAEIATASRHGFLHLTRDTAAPLGLGWRMAPVWFPTAQVPPVDTVPSNNGDCAK